jgi:hypothetical protein
MIVLLIDSSGSDVLLDTEHIRSVQYCVLHSASMIVHNSGIPAHASRVVTVRSRRSWLKVAKVVCYRMSLHPYASVVRLLVGARGGLLVAPHQRVNSCHFMLLGRAGPQTQQILVPPRLVLGSTGGRSHQSSSLVSLVHPVSPSPRVGFVNGEGKSRRRSIASTINLFCSVLLCSVADLS